MEITLGYIALPGWYLIGSVINANLQSGTDEQQNTHMAWLLHLQHVQLWLLLCYILQQADYVSHIHIQKACRCIKLSSLRNV
jgi:hypothetical protein